MPGTNPHTFTQGQTQKSETAAAEGQHRAQQPAPGKVELAWEVAKEAGREQGPGLLRKDHLQNLQPGFPERMG